MEIRRERFSALLIRILLTIAITAIVTSFPFYYLEYLFYDAKFRSSPVSENSNKISLIKIDKKSVDHLQRNPSLKELTALLNNISLESPKRIIVLLNPEKMYFDQVSEKSDLVSAASSYSNIVFLDDNFPSPNSQNKPIYEPPLDKLQTKPGVLSVDLSNFAADNVTRRAIIYAENQWLLHSETANLFTGFKDPKQYRGSFNFRESIQLMVNHKPANTFPAYSFIDILDNRFAKDSFRDKIVIVGNDSFLDISDYHKSVFNRDPVAISKLEVHANIIDTLIQNSGVINSPRWLDVLLTGLISLLTVFVVFSLKPVQGLITLLGTLVAFCGISWIAFAGFRYSIGMAHPLIAIFVSYYFFIPYRLIRENRKSWEYEQKNKLLTQVEELKTNFLGMMSHDLKTPLARIQGMADIALADSSNLSIPQKEALKSINKSSEELTEFISSILDLSRVESQNIKLHLESKDINQLLEQVIHKYEFLAKEKNITFIKEMEPLFSVKIDVDLMRQVFSNLIENAIKYSPNGSKVLVSTEEIGNKIVVQVADQGIGIPTDELNKIFMKFYRTNNVRNSPTKGSGLGLYLAKYFVELHKGHISVESKPQQGSTFTVDIPTV